MQEAIDYNALSWVRKELGETLRQARLELESYADGNDSNELLQRCAAQLHQARGPLRMVNLKGADLLACEMEEAIADLLLGTVPDQETLLEFLMQGFLELPEYLSSLRSGRHDTPMAMFPVINSLRATRGLDPLREEEIFAPNLSCRVPPEVFDVREWHDESELATRARAARVRFQAGLLEWYRGGEDNEGVNELLDVLEHLQEIACSEPVARLWWVGAGVAELLRDGVLPDSAVVKRLFGQLDRNIKRLMDYGESVFSDLLTDDLLRNLLFQITHAGAASGRIRLIRQTYGLPEPSSSAEGKPAELSDELLHTVSLTVREDVDRIKDQLDTCLRAPDQQPGAVAEVADELHALGNMLGMIGMDQLGAAVSGQEQHLRRLQDGSCSADDINLAGMANTLIAVEDALVDLSGSLGSTGGEDHGEVTYRQGREAVIEAIMTDMQEAKESINGFLKSNGNFDQLGNVPVLLHKIHGGLVLAGEESLAAATGQVQRFITRELLAEHRSLTEAELDDMADAICSIEYCVEQLAGNQNYGDRALRVAAKSLDRLGYPVSAVCIDDDEPDPGADAPDYADETVSWQPDSITGLPAAEEPETASGRYRNDPEPADEAASEPAEVEVPVEVPAATWSVLPKHSAPESILTLQVVAPDADPEIVEIFIEEAGEVLDELSATIPAWRGTPENADLLAGIRRGFHTIKGSGRMIGALATGEFGWALEQMLNRMIEHVMPVSARVVELVERSVPALRQLVAQVRDASCVPDIDVNTLAQQAFALASGVTEEPASEPDQPTGAAVEGDAPAAGDEAVPAESVAVFTGQPVLAEDADPEIVEIFLDEAAEELVTLRIAISSWVARPEDTDLLVDVRRSFHTLKGSGRMAGAMRIGELAWQVEVLMNRLLDGVLEHSPAMSIFLTRVPGAIQEMLEQIRSGATPGRDVEALMAQAVAFASGEQQPVASGANDGASATVPEPADEDDPELLELYATECGEHLRVLADCVATAGETEGVSEQMFRALHTLTGISESAQVPGIGALVEPLYEYFGGLYHDDLPVVPAAYAVLDDCVHEMQRLHAQLPSLSFDERNVTQLQDRIHALAGTRAGVQEAEPAGPEPWAAPGARVEDPAMPGATADTVFDPESGPGDEAEYSADAVPGDTLPDEPLPTMVAQEAEPGVSAAWLPEPVAEDLPAAAEVADVYAAMDPELYEIFVEESAEIMEAGENVLRDWSGAPDNRELMTEFQRMLHTLKGSARMVDIGTIGDLSHAVESLLGRVAEGRTATSAELFVLLNEAFDRLADMLDRVKSRVPTEPATGLEQRLQEFIQGAVVAGPDGPGAKDSGSEYNVPDTVETHAGDTQQQPVREPADESGFGVAGDDAADIPDESGTAAVRPQHVAASPDFPAFSEIVARSRMDRAQPDNQGKNRQGRVEQVRVQAEILDNLVSNAGEISIYRSRMEQQVSNYRFSLGELDATINRLRDQLRQLEMETEAQILYRFEQESDGRNEDFDPLEMDRYSTLQQLSRSLIESISDLLSLQEIMEQTTRDAETLLLQQTRVSTDLQESLIRTRMVPFAGLAPRLRRIVRQTARELNKKVELELHGADGEMDRSVADRFVASLEHMLRNAIAHGIESPEQRVRHDKPETGTIHIDFDREGPEIVLRISDDGAGLDLQMIRERAIERGLIPADARLSDHELMQFILATGFSTAGEVTQISGRGVGMDVVNSEVKQLGGSLQIETEAGKGTVFTVRLPYTLAINQALLVRAGEDTFFVPLSTIEGVVRVFPEELMTCYQSEEQRFEHAGNGYRLRHLGTLLGSGGMDLQHIRHQVPVLLLRIGDQRIGMQVESLLGNHEVVIKPLGAQLSTVEGISGATILGDGRVVLILDMVALSRMNSHSMPGDAAIRPQTSNRLMVMVVDDSITVRKVTSRLLERNGYQVLTAKDGVDAMGQLQEILPDMVLLDIEMPRMDGFELATHMRNDERLHHVPIIMITSRTGDKHRERAREIGVNEYLGKPYQESELLDSIQNIIGVNPVAATG